MLAGIQWQSPQMLGVSLLVGVLVIVAVTLLYPGQTRSLPTMWRVALPSLRCGALIALAISVAKPFAQRTLTDDEQGTVVVLVDHSRSMDQRDTQRTPAMWVALADGLGRLPENARSRGEAFEGIASTLGRLSPLVEAIGQAQVELEVADLQGKENPVAQKRFDELAGEFGQVSKTLLESRAKLKARSPRLAEAIGAMERLGPVDTRAWSQRVGPVIAEIAKQAAQFQTESDDALYRARPEVKRICDELAGMTRFKLVEQALVDADTGLLSKLPMKTPVYGYGIGPGAEPLALRAGTKNITRVSLEPLATRSDLTGGLREALDQLRYRNLQAVVLFSDGRQVGAEATISTNLLGGSVPVFTVSPAPAAREAAVKDVSIERVSLPQSLFIGETLNVTAEVRWTGLAKPGEMILQTAGATQRQAIRQTGDGAGVAKFAMVMNDAGPQKLTISVPGVAGEICSDNNTVMRWVKVLSDKFDVLLVGGAPTWDFRYLRNTLSRTREWIDLQSVILEGENARLALTPDQILSQDAIVLCDTPAKALGPEQWDAVRKMVAQRGGSLIMMAGQAHLPLEYGSEAMGEFLPFKRSGGRGAGLAVWRVWPGEEPEFRVVPAPGLGVADMLPLDDQPQISAERWQSLPPLFRYLALPPLKEVAQPLLVERASGTPILTRQRLGRGKVFFLGVDETWRWRYKVGERDQDTFFRQLLRNATDEPYAVSNGLISLDADRVTIDPGETVRVRARLIEPSATGINELDFDVLRDDKVVKTQRLTPVGAADSGRFEAILGGLGEGEYRLRIRSPDASELEYPLHVAKNYEAELLNLNPDEELLRRLGNASGGDFRTLDQFKGLFARLSAIRERAPKTSEFRLWNSWYLYSFVVACLGAEWALRKRFGLV